MRLARSTFYAKNEVDLQGLKEEADLRDRIERIVLAYPGYGYRRVTHQLRRESFRVNHKRVLRVMGTATCSVDTHGVGGRPPTVTTTF